jgi:hypothetical protein
MNPEIQTVHAALDAACETLESLVEDDGLRADLDATRLQRLLAAYVRVYWAKSDRDGYVGPFPDAASTPSPTEVVVVADDMLAAVQIEPFELAMWRGWGNARRPPAVTQ